MDMITLTERQLTEIIRKSVIGVLSESRKAEKKGKSKSENKVDSAEATSILKNPAFNNAEIGRMLKRNGILPAKWSEDTVRSYLSKQGEGERPLKPGEAVVVKNATEQ